LESKNRIGEGEVVKIEVEEAHTYVMEGIISHNIKAATIE
jgi:intein/homing endonuclease